MSTTKTFTDTIFKSRILNHVGFWVLILLVFSFHGSLFGGNWSENLLMMCSLLPVQITATYLLVYVQLPKLLFKGHWFFFFLSFLFSAYILSVLARLSIIYIGEPLIGYEGIDESLWEVMTDPAYLFKVYVTSAYLPAFLFVVIKLTKDQFVQQNKMIQLEKEKSSAELNFLKAQMNPHFLFNTLNNIYSLAKSKSEQTPEMIMKLSELLDYTIYECNEKEVPITKEWELIENYADLQAVRYHEKLSLVLGQQIDDENVKIAPLILISLVENAFKHSLKSTNRLPEIVISLNVKNKLLTFEVFNTKSDKKIEKEGTSKKGIGVRNIKQQLELLYPDRHALTIDEQPHSYKATLTIQLQNVQL